MPKIKNEQLQLGNVPAFEIRKTPVEGIALFSNEDTLYVKSTNDSSPRKIATTDELMTPDNFSFSDSAFTVEKLNKNISISFNSDYESYLRRVTYKIPELIDVAYYRSEVPITLEQYQGFGWSDYYEDFNIRHSEKNIENITNISFSKYDYNPETETWGWTLIKENITPSSEEIRESIGNIELRTSKVLEHGHFVKFKFEITYKDFDNNDQTITKENKTIIQEAMYCGKLRKDAEKTNSWPNLIINDKVNIITAYNDSSFIIKNETEENYIYLVYPEYDPYNVINEKEELTAKFINTTTGFEVPFKKTPYNKFESSNGETNATMIKYFIYQSAGFVNSAFTMKKG